MNSIEEKLASEAGIPFLALPSHKLDREFSARNLRALFCLGKGFVAARRALNRFRPDLVIGTGGYVSASVVMAQALRKGRVLIHEQNVVPGRTNLWLSRYADRVCVTFEDSLKHFPAGRTTVTGLPVRSTLLHLPARADAHAALGLVGDRFTLLVLGGSQGARSLNEVIAGAIPLLREMPVQVLHQVGPRNIEDAQRKREDIGWEHYHVRAYLDDMASACAASDLAVSRAGASTIAELTVAGLPAIYVPYPFAYADHQRYNGEFVSRRGGGILIGDSEIAPEFVARTVSGLLDSPDELRRMADAGRSLGRPDAAAEIARIAAELAG